MHAEGAPRPLIETLRDRPFLGPVVANDLELQVKEILGV